MKFNAKLRVLMKDTNATQTQICNMTGISKASMSQYLSGKNEPSEQRKRDIAIALGVQEDYFDSFLPPEIEIQKNCVNLPITMAARLMGKSVQWVAKGLQDGVFPWGYAVHMKDWSYFISSVKFEEYTGIKVPYKNEEAKAI